MIQFANGKIEDRIAVAANAMYPTYVIQGDTKNLMIDAGINLFAPLYIESLKEILGSIEELHYLFITHSHYDHLGAMPYLKNVIPGLKLGGAPRITELLKKESVLKMMNRLSDIQRSIFKDITTTDDVTIHTVALDLPLKEGDEFDLGGITCRVYELPGHTRDCLGYYIPELNALFPGEALGVLEGTGENREVQVEFLASYQDYLTSIERMIDLKPRLIGLGHGHILTDDDAINFLDESLKATPVYKKKIEGYLSDAAGDVEAAIEAMVKKEYDEKGTIFQERNAYLTNLTAQVKHIAALTAGVG